MLCYLTIRVKSITPTKKQSESTRLSDSPILILCTTVRVRKFAENVTKTFLSKQYATRKEFYEFKSCNYQKIA